MNVLSKKSRMRQMFQYGDNNLSITELLQKPEIVGYLEKNGPLTYTSQRDKLCKLLREGKINPQLVLEYAAQHPPVERVIDTRYGTQRRRANLPKKDTKGRTLFGPEPTPITRRRNRAILINGERLTARQTLERYPQLRGYLQLERRLAERTLHAKLRRDFKNGRIPDHILNENPPQFQIILGALDLAVRDYILDDPRIRNYDIPSLFNYPRPQIVNLMQQNFNTKVYLNVKTKMAKIGGEYMEDTFKFYSGEFEIFPGTDLNDILKQMESTIMERFAKLEQAVGSGWSLIGIIDVKMHFANYQPLAGSSYVKLPKVIRDKGAVVNIGNKDDNECFKYAVTQALNPVAKNAGRITKELKEQ